MSDNTHPTHTGKDGERYLVRVSRTSSYAMAGIIPSIYKGDVYLYQANDLARIPQVVGHLKASEFEAAFTPLPGQEIYHQECLEECRTINGD